MALSHIESRSAALQQNKEKISGEPFHGRGSLISLGVVVTQLNDTTQFY